MLWVNLSSERRVTIGIPTAMSPTRKPLEAALEFAHGPVFPLFKFTFVEAKKKQSYEARVEVAPSIYKLLTRSYRGNATVIFIDFSTPLGIFTGDMIECFNLLSEAKLMSPIDRWLIVARERISKVLANQKGTKPEPSNSTKEAVNTSQQLLKAAGLLKEVDEKNEIFAIARDVMQSSKKDLDTAIYRLGMAVYWTKLVSSQSLLPELEDTSKLYLDFTSDQKMRNQFKGFVQSMEARDGADRNEFVRTLMCFIVAAYVCNRVLLQERNL